jgi:hydrogenase maturation factor/predicted fused transcriptional regulator/phosphomethylpyrimidine kinase
MKKNERVELFGKMSEAVSLIENCTEFVSLIPEVRTNLVYAAEDAKTPESVLGIEGRITVVGDRPSAAGKLKFGSSSHMARLILELRKKDPRLRSGINFAASSKLAGWLDNYCRKKGWVLSQVDRRKEPAGIQDEELLSMPWKVREAIRSARGKIPKIFIEKGAVGKEDLTVLVGEDPVEVAGEACKIARLFLQSQQPEPKIGKIDFETFTSFLLKRLGRKNPSVIVPPYTGVDAGVIDIGYGKVLIVAEDPIFSIPRQPLEMFGWYTVHIGASDVAVMGVRPRYMTYTLLMPPQTSDKDFRAIVNSIHKTAVELEIAIVGGHTGFYPGFAAPTIGGITVFAVADKERFVTPAGALPGDDVILTKGPAIETAGILSVLREKELLKKYPQRLVERAKALCKEMTVVKDALAAMEAGGVTAMHDATEGGVVGGLFEMANASRVGMDIDERRFIYPEEVRMVCEAFGIDAATAIAEGSLLITVRPTHSQKVIRKLKALKINASVIGRVNRDSRKRIMRRTDGSTMKLAIPKQDPFWLEFFKGLETL